MLDDNKRIEIKFCENLHDAKRCNDFYNKFNSKKRSLKQWQWLFETLNKNKLFFVFAELEGKIVGTQALIPINFISKDGTYLTAKSEETLLCPSVRGMGVFVKMYDFIYKRLEEEDIKIIWGFTPAIKPFEKAGFKIPCFTNQLILPLKFGFFKSFQKQENLNFFYKIIKMLSFVFVLISTIKISFNKKKIPRQTKSQLKLKYLNRSTDEFEKITSQFINSWDANTILRDKNFIDWRLYKNPFIKPNVIGLYESGSLVGWISYSIDENLIAYLVDIQVIKYQQNNEEVITKVLLLKLIEDVSNAGAILIRGWFLNSNNFDRFIKKECKKLGFFTLKKGNPVVWKNLTSDKNYDMDNERFYINRVFTSGVLG